MLFLFRKLINKALVLLYRETPDYPATDRTAAGRTRADPGAKVKLELGRVSSLSW